MKARKSHKCGLCGYKIQAGETYTRYSGKNDGELFDEKYHESCWKAINRYGEESGESEYDNEYVYEFVRDTYCSEYCDCTDEGSEKFDTCEYDEMQCPRIIKWIDNGFRKVPGEAQLSVCKRDCNCVDCTSKECLRAGDIGADCPLYKCKYPIELGIECEKCEWIKRYLDRMKQGGQNGETKDCLSCRLSMSADREDGSQYLVCSAKEYAEVEEDDCCEDYQ